MRCHDCHVESVTTSLSKILGLGTFAKIINFRDIYRSLSRAGIILAKFTCCVVHGIRRQRHDNQKLVNPDRNLKQQKI